MIGKASLLAVVLVSVLSACSSTHEMPSQGQTHWLSSCDDDSECGELSCVCGACVELCDASGGCDVEGRNTSCYGAFTTSVQVMCGGADVPSVCLEECDGECPTGQSCIDGACVVEQEAETETPDAAAPDADAEIIEPRDFEIGVANVSDKPVVLEATGCNGSPAWFTLSVDGEPLNLYAGCTCESADEQGYCPSTPPVCAESTFEVVDPGEEFAFTWDLAAWPSDANGCSERMAIPPDTEIELKVDLSDPHVRFAR